MTIIRYFDFYITVRIGVQISERSLGVALSQQGLKAGHKVGDSGFKLEKGTKATVMHTQELRAQ